MTRQWVYPRPLPEPSRISKLSALQPAVLVRYVEGLRECKRRGLNVGPFETKRTPERQLWLYNQGRMWPGDIVTNVSTPDEGWHPAGIAADSAFFNTAGDPVWNVGAELWSMYGLIMEDHGLAWGGRWKRPDSPHVQAANVPKTPTHDDGQDILKGNLLQLATKYDLLTISYYDVAGRV